MAPSEGQPQKHLAVRQAAFIGVGAMVGAGIFSLLGPAGEVAGAAVWISFLLAGAIAGLQGYSFAKFGARYPSAGGLLEYVQRAYGAGGIMLATLSFTFVSMTEASSTLAATDQERIATVLEEDAQVLSNTDLGELLAEQPDDVAAEIVRINTDARPRALQAALLVPLIAALIGFVNGFRMMRLPDVTPPEDIDGMVLGG